MFDISNYSKVKRNVFDTAINTAAIGLITFGALEIQKGNWISGGISIGFGFGLEFLKYTLRKYAKK